MNSLLLVIGALALSFVSADRINEGVCRQMCQEQYTNQKERFACTKGCNTGANDIDCYDTKVGCPIVTPANQFICYGSCMLAKDACYINPCQHGGTCTSLLDSNLIPYSICNCTSAFIGDHCEIPDPCNDITCYNDGECVSNQDGTIAECICVEGFAGFDCSEVLDPCTPSPCLVGGVCTLDPAQPDGYKCDCPPGAQGIACDVEVPNFDECAAAPCQNGGTCTVGGYIGDTYYDYGTFTCTCAGNFVGDLCQDVNPCATSTCNPTGTAACTYSYDSGSVAQVCLCNQFFFGSLCEIKDTCAELTPCQHGGSCINDVTNALGYVCDCPSNWRGQKCQLDVDECALTGAWDMCVNGDCTNTPGSYNCQCKNGWGGATCNTDIDECLIPNFCENDGSCTNTIGGFSCECQADFTGKYCETKIDDCPVEKVCKHGGQCIDGIGEYTCECAAGWAGADCSRKTGRWVQFRKYYFLDIAGPRLTYEGAQSACALAHSKLASLHNQDENDFVALLARPNNKHPRWIGAMREYDPAGTVESNLVNFKWDDGSAFDFTNFFRGEPNNIGDNEDCLSQGHSELGFGMWNDAKCSEARRYVCKKIRKN